MKGEKIIRNSFGIVVFGLIPYKATTTTLDTTTDEAHKGEVKNLKKKLGKSQTYTIKKVIFG